uniref:High potential iron-sulfur proteins family profile domain-containing protein n=1 Tax=viral metagenome TaxID=1070528 RepID=A0A6H2A2R9_9ZZZZ
MDKKTPLNEWQEGESCGDCQHYSWRNTGCNLNDHEPVDPYNGWCEDFKEKEDTP